MRQRMMLLLLLILSSAVLIVTTGCEKNGKIQIHNRTSFPVYANILDEAYTVEPATSRIIDVPTDTQTPFTGIVSKQVKVDLIGETFQIWNPETEQYQNSTYTTVNAGETTNIYTLPNRASVKVENHSGMHIKEVLIQRNTTLTSFTETHIVDLPNGETWFTPVAYATADNSFYLHVQVIFDDDSVQDFGNEQTIIHLDEQFLIDVLPPARSATL